MMATWTIKITPALLQQLVAEVDDKRPLETGGVLAGWVEGSFAVVTHVIGPGPKAIHQPSFFLRDGDYAQEQIERVTQETFGKSDYLGEWHSHMAAVGPSPQDRVSMRRISKNSTYACNEPFLLLCTLSPSGQWSLVGFRWSRGQLRDVSLVGN